MKRKKHLVLLFSIVLLLTAVAGGTLAFIAVKTASVQNQFESAYVTCQVNVNDDNSIDLMNTGNVDAYIRAAIIVNWMDSEGNVLGAAPKEAVDENGGDYSLVINNTTWQKDDTTGFYYYKARVGASESTDNLIDYIYETTDNRPSSYTLSIEVIAEAIQADGVTDADGTPAVQDAWFNPLTEEAKAILNAWGITPLGN